MPVRVRFAPSPTGPFSLGNARTALFNWLFARHEGGEFLLRIEDTDKERSKKEYENQILESLEWLGLAWNGDIVRQSERIDIYEHYLEQLLNEKKAYYCFCLPEELESERQAQLSQGLPPKYGGKCKNLESREVEARREKEPAVLRFKMPSAAVSFTDLVRGKVSFDAGLMGDIVIAKNTREPLYNFAVVIDDNEMNITHVIRGEDHLSNTPKQWLIQEALGFKHPIYAHLPLILGPDRKKLSKRYLDTSLLDFKHKGYLPQAILNFLALLGWHPEEDREVLTANEMIDNFTLPRVQKGGAIFNPEKLEWLNGYYLRNMNMDDLLTAITPFIPERWREHKILIKKVLETEKERLKRLSDFTELAGFFFELPDYKKELLVWKNASEDATTKNLEHILRIIQKTPVKDIETAVNAFAEQNGRGEVFWPLRAALSGKSASPAPLDILRALGKEESERRVKIAIEKLKEKGLGI